MRQIVIAICLLFVINTFSQERAPTPIQCQADEKWWRAQSIAATDASGFSPSIAALSTGELLNRAKELMSCVAGDSSGSDRYQSTAMVILSQTTKRFGRYIQETGQTERYLAWEEQQRQATTGNPH